MRRVLALSLLLLMSSASAIAAETRYISDKLYIPLRSGAGNDYRIIHRGLASGTQMELKQTSGDGEFAEVVLADGTTGWLRVQYLTSEPPARNKLSAAQSRIEMLSNENNELKVANQTLSDEKLELLNQIVGADGSMVSVTQELAELKQVSGNAQQADADIHRLNLEAEELRSEVEMLEAENLRLRENLDSEAFYNGALAVLLGVIITLVVPRLWPKRRRNSSWA